MTASTGIAKALATAPEGARALGRVIRRVVDRDRESSREAVSRAHRRGDHLEFVGQLIGEQLALLCEPSLHHGTNSKGNHESDEESARR